MPDQRSRIAKRVVRSLEADRDPDSLVWSHFDEDRRALIEATRETLEATREDASEQRIADAVDRELIEALRYPDRPRRALPALLWVHRVGVAAGLGFLLAALSVLWLMA